jgi:urea transporter
LSEIAHKYLAEPVLDTAGWDAMSPLYLGGVMALVGSGTGAALAILNKLPTAEIRLGL